MQTVSFELVVIDLDNTVYSPEAGVFARLDERMTAFVARELRLSRDAASDLRRRYWRRYGATLRGLILHHGVDAEAFLREVHDVPIHGMLAPDAELDSAIARLPGRKVIHTNGIREHAERVLDALGIRRHFTAIYDIRFHGYRPKPSRQAISALLRREGCDPAQVLVVDDSEENLRAAWRIGARTAWIGEGAGSGTWDYRAASLAELCRALTPGDGSAPLRRPTGAFST